MDESQGRQHPKIVDTANQEPHPEPVSQQASEVDLAGLKGRSARGAAITLTSQFLRFLISFGGQIWLAHLLIPADFGVVAMAAPVAAFVTLFTDLGLSQATIQRKEITQEELSSLFWINVGAGCFFAAVMMMLSPLAVLLYHDARVGPIIRALALVLPLSGLVAQSVALMNRHMQFLPLSIMDVSAALLGAVAGVLSAYVGAGYWALVIQQAVAALTTLCMAFTFSRWRPLRPGIGKEIRSLLRFGGHLTTFNIVSYFSLYFDNVLVGVLSGAVALGFFDRAFKLVVAPLSQLSAPIARVALPMLARLQDDANSYRRAYVRMLQSLLLITGPGMMCICVLSLEVTITLLGRNWLGTVPMLRWLSIAGFISTFTMASCWLMISQDRVAEQTKCGFISAGLIMLALLAGVRWGAVGICVSYALFAPLVHGTFVWISTRRGPVRLKDVLAASYPIVLAVAVAAVAFALLSTGMRLPPLPRIILGLVFCYGCTVALLAIFPAGRVVLRDVWRLRNFFRFSRAVAGA